jgi:hypothetical protein
MKITVPVNGGVRPQSGQMCGRSAEPPNRHRKPNHDGVNAG